jgi:predicted cation transporter
MTDGTRRRVLRTIGAVGIGCALLAVAVPISTVASEKARALGLVLLAWVWFVLAHDLVSLGVVSAFGLPNVALSAMVLTNPPDSFES